MADQSKIAQCPPVFVLSTKTEPAKQLQLVRPRRLVGPQVNKAPLTTNDIPWQSKHPLEPVSQRTTKPRKKRETQRINCFLCLFLHPRNDPACRDSPAGCRSSPRQCQPSRHLNTLDIHPPPNRPQRPHQFETTPSSSPTLPPPPATVPPPPPPPPFPFGLGPAAVRNPKSAPSSA